ncbi:peptide deformylase [Brachybacterium huguangmaarense]
MTYRPIRVIGDPVLRTPCEPIREITDGVRTLVADLLETVDEEGRAGLAANQIGVSLRAFSWHLEDDLGYILNPVITYLSEETQDDDEGCLSVPGLWYPRTRAMYARCEGADLDGKEVVLEGTEIVARLIQHEVGHLDGQLYVDGLERPVKKRALRDIRERF